MIIDSPPNLCFHSGAFCLRETAGGRDVSLLFPVFGAGRVSHVKTAAIGVAETPESGDMAAPHASVRNTSHSARFGITCSVFHLEQSD